MPASCREGLSSSPGPSSGGLRITLQAASEAELRTVLAVRGVNKVHDPDDEGLVGLDWTKMGDVLSQKFVLVPGRASLGQLPGGVSSSERHRRLLAGR